MRVFLLGAGQPAHGQKPSALKDIGLNTRAMDWQIQSFASVASKDDIHFLGGYQFEAVAAQYPRLNFTIVPDWANTSVLHTFLKAPFADGPAFTAYSDTVFHAETIAAMSTLDTDVVFGIDSLWRDRYSSRPEKDIELAETIKFEDESGCYSDAEFTGLIYFSREALVHVSTLDETAIGTNLIHLLNHLTHTELSVQPFDVLGQWAEFNYPGDIARFVVGNKAQTLARLQPLVRCSKVGKQVSFTLESWQEDPSSILDQITRCFGQTQLIVRSSSAAEDNWDASNAGGFESLLNIDSTYRADVVKSINSVFASYGSTQNSTDQVLVQEFVRNVQASGVVFTRGLETGAPYYRFNFDDQTGTTDKVTGGSQANFRTIIASRFDSSSLQSVEPKLVPVLNAVREHEQLLGFDKLDVEFAIAEDGSIHTFQVRPITVDHSQYEVDLVQVEASLADSVSRFQAMQARPAFVFGEKAIFGNMPDWNPAEIIGTRPRPMALSLYRKLITDKVWARQRAEFGYRDVSPQPLIISFCGQPYVDVRASFNSFIPACLEPDIARRLVNAYINILSDHPQYHDKIEFEVAFTVWTADLLKAADSRLLPYEVTAEDMTSLEAALKKITRNALVRLPSDVASIDEMNRRREAIEASTVSHTDKFIALIEDCERFGTLAFSHAARAGFVATTLLQSLVTTGILNHDRRSAFLRSFSTVAGEFESDKRACASGQMRPQEIIEKYGHLRPGTYELGTLAYWEDSDFYLACDESEVAEQNPEFKLGKSEVSGTVRMLCELESGLSALEFFTYLREAIQAREFIKFEFTKNLSSALTHCVKLGEDLGIDRADMSYLNFHDLEEFKLNSVPVGELEQRIDIRKKAYAVTQLVELPTVIRREADFHCFERHAAIPNFVTTQRIEAVVQCLDDGRDIELHGKVVLVPQADPGYDWLFAHGIAGLIIKYGGANSHMAIRAAEIGLPAVIGVGESLYEKIACMKRVELDCGNQTIRSIE